MASKSSSIFGAFKKKPSKHNYLNRNCHCQKRAAIYISELEKHPNKLYAKCPNNLCRYWDWLHPTVEEEQGISEELEFLWNSCELDSLRMDITLVKQRLARMGRHLLLHL